MILFLKGRTEPRLENLGPLLEKKIDRRIKVSAARLRLMMG